MEQEYPQYLKEIKFKAYIATRVFEDMWDLKLDISDIPRLLMEIANDVAAEIKRNSTL